MTSTFFLDGAEIPFKEGQTVLQAAMSAGRYIPHLCWRPNWNPTSVECARSSSAGNPSLPAHNPR